MKKRILCVLLAGVMAGTVFTGCGAQKAPANSQKEQNEANKDNGQDEQKDTSVATHEHDYESAITIEATCNESGEMTYTCACGDSYTEEIGKTDHETDLESTTIQKEATCSEEGLRIYHCIFCGESVYDEVIEKTEHVESDWIIDAEPSADTDGLRHKVCTICGEEIVSESFSAE